MVDPPPRRQKLAAPAPPYLSHRHPWGSALSLAGEGGPEQTSGIWVGPKPSVRLPRRSLGRGKTSCAAPPESVAPPCRRLSGGRSSPAAESGTLSGQPGGCRRCRFTIAGK